MKGAGTWLDCVLSLLNLFVGHNTTFQLRRKSMYKHLGIMVLIILTVFSFFPSTIVFAHPSWGSHQHDEDDPDDTTFLDVVDKWLELVPGYDQVKTTVGWLQHKMYTPSTPYYTTSDIGGGFYRCSCGVSYSYYDSHSH